MKKTMMAVAVLYSSVALAQGTPPPAGGTPPPAAAAPAAPDMTKVGPMTRKVTKEDKKGVDALYKSFEDAMKKGDVNAAAALVDFPVLMMTDDSAGVFAFTTMDKAAWTKMMAPMMTTPPKDMKMTSKHTAVFMSDTWANVTEDVSMTMGKVKGSWHSVSNVVLKDGKWLVKSMAEAGWGDMAKQQHASAATGTPSKT